MLNLMQNIDLCPNTKTINSCVREQDCTRFVQSGWFQMYIERSGQVTTDMVAEAALTGNVKLAQVGLWVGVKTMAEAEEAAVAIADRACLDRRDELIDGPLADTKPKSADTLSSFNAANYLAMRSTLGIDISWDNVNLRCNMCTEATMAHYFSNMENSAEVLEVLILCVTCYISAMLIKLANKEETNSPIGDLSFESDPTSGNDMNVDKIEKAALGIMSEIFFHRYAGGNVPDQVKRVEQKIRYATEQGMDTKNFADPFKVDNSAQTWNNYSITDIDNARMFIVNRDLLGILEGEEIISAWSETPRLTIWQKIVLFGGFFFFFVCPISFGAAAGQLKCMVEGFVAGFTHLFLFYYFVLQRRVQAGIVLTTRRVFQISRTPAYRDLFGKVEPLLKLDVLVHNSSVFYLSGTFESLVPLHRTIMARCCNWPVFRSGCVTVQSYEGVIRLWRDRGDARETIEAWSKCGYAEPCDQLNANTGRIMMEKEKLLNEHTPKDPCMPLILCCCPTTPAPPFAHPDLIKRYCMRYDKEADIYGRMLSMRAASCLDIFCGKGCCRCACELCPCCMVDESICDFMVTSHRTLVEQRVSMRYCRCCICARPAPNIRVTFLSNFRASSYVMEKSSAAQGINLVRQDMTVKLLPENARTFPSGLMLRQQPYKFVNSRTVNSDEMLWTKHMSQIYDAMTERDGAKELIQSESEDEDD